jgi:hypothetical protein
MRLELALTLEGFGNRSSVITTVFDCLTRLRNAPPNRESIAQYCTVAQLYGHVLVPRPPDAIELGFDGQIYGVDDRHGVAGGSACLLPLPDDRAGVRLLQRTMTAGNVFEEKVPPQF